MKVALVHDYLREYGGAERVVEALHEIFPDAPIFAAYLNLKTLGPSAARIGTWDVRTSWLQKIPFAGKMLSPLRIIAPLIFEGFDLSAYEVVISSTGVYFSDAVITKPQTLHLAYIHTPPKYLYGYETSFNYKKHWWTRVGAEVANHLLRVWDYETSQRPDVLVANSKTTAKRIRKFYRREAVVIYPPVDIKNIQERSKEYKKDGGYYLALGRVWKTKGVDLVVEACAKAGVPLKVAGTGPDLESIKKRASKDITVLGEVSDEERIKLLAAAKALILATQDEDFGITAVEAQAAGTPVIALRSGGYLETIIEGKTGEFFPSTLLRQVCDREAQTESAQDRSGQVQDLVQALVEVLLNFDPKKYKNEDLRKNAERFSKERFKERILGLIKENNRYA